MIWVYLILLAAVVVAIWLAIIVVKWLFILALVAGAVWMLLLLRRRLA